MHNNHTRQQSRDSARRSEIQRVDRQKIHYLWAYDETKTVWEVDHAITLKDGQDYVTSFYDVIWYFISIRLWVDCGCGNAKSTLSFPTSDNVELQVPWFIVIFNKDQVDGGVEIL